GAGKKRGEAPELDRLEPRLSGRWREGDALPVHEEEPDSDEEQEGDQLPPGEKVAGQGATAGSAVVQGGESADHGDGERDLRARAVQRGAQEREIASEPARDRSVGEQVGGQRHPTHADSHPAAERIPGVEIGATIAISAARGFAKTEADEQANAADREPGGPGESAGVAKNLGGEEEDAGADDPVDAEPDAVEQRHSVCRSHRHQHARRRTGSQAKEAASLSLDSESFLSMMRASFREKTLFFCRRRHLEAAVLLKGIDADD